MPSKHMVTAMLDGLVFKRRCERCPAVEEIPTTLEELQAGAVGEDSDREVSVSVGNVEIVNYQYVCKSCWEILSAHVADMATQPKKKSSLRKRKKAQKEN